MKKILNWIGLYTRRDVEIEKERLMYNISKTIEEQNKAPDVLYDENGNEFRKFYGEFGIIYLLIKPQPIN